MINLENKLKSLYLQKENIEEEIKSLEEQIKNEKEKASKPLKITFTKNEKIDIFKSLFIARKDIYAKKWISKDGNKQGFYPVTRTFQGEDYIPSYNTFIVQLVKIRTSSLKLIALTKVNNKQVFSFLGKYTNA